MGKLKIIKDLVGITVLTGWYGPKAAIYHRIGKTTHKIHKEARSYYDKSLNHIGISVESSNLENLIDPPAIVVSNHTTHLDIASLTKVISSGKHPVIFIAKKELLDYPLLGIGMKALGMIGRDRDHPRETLKNIKKGVDKAKKEGHYLVMYPEGRRTTLKNYEMLPFDSGPFFTAVEYGLPIVLVASYGGLKLLPKNTWETKLGTMKLKILEPMHPDDYTGTKKERRNQMMEIARSRLQEGIDSLRPKKQTS